MNKQSRKIILLRKNYLAENENNEIEISLPKEQLEKKCREDDIYRFMLNNISKEKQNIGTKEAMIEYFTMSRSDGFYKATGIINSQYILGAHILKIMEFSNIITKEEIKEILDKKSKKTLEKLLENKEFNRDEIKKISKYMNDISLKGNKNAMFEIIKLIKRKQYETQKGQEIKESYLKEIYEKTKNNLLKNVKEEYHEELLKEYKNYIEMIYNNLTVNEDEMIKEEIRINNKLLISYSENDKMSLYLQDYSYEKLFTASNRAYKLGLKRVKENNLIDKEKIKRCAEEMKKYLKKVREFNSIRANRIYKDSILDLKYADDKEDFYSMRISDAIINKI